MPLDGSIIAAFAGVAGLTIGKLGDMLIDRLKSADTKAVGISTALNEHQKMIFDQQNIVITKQWERLAEVESDSAAWEDRARDAEDKLRRYTTIEADLIVMRANFADCSRRLAYALAGIQLDDEPTYPLPRIRRPLPGEPSLGGVVTDGYAGRRKNADEETSTGETTPLDK